MTTLTLIFTLINTILFVTIIKNNIDSRDKNRMENEEVKLNAEKWRKSISSKIGLIMQELKKR